MAADPLTKHRLSGQGGVEGAIQPPPLLPEAWSLVGNADTEEPISLYKCQKDLPRCNCRGSKSRRVKGSLRSDLGGRQVVSFKLRPSGMERAGDSEEQPRRTLAPGALGEVGCPGLCQSGRQQERDGVWETVRGL